MHATARESSANGSASEGDSETNRNVVWWPMKRVKSSNQEFAIAGRLVTIKTRRTSRVRIRSYVVSVLPNRGLAFHSTSAFPASKAATAWSTAACCSGRRT